MVDLVEEFDKRVRSGSELFRDPDCERTLFVILALSAHWCLTLFRRRASAVVYSFSFWALLRTFSRWDAEESSWLWGGDSLIFF